MAHGINGKVILITGGASGIGKATALAFAREGARVFIATARSLKAAEDTVAEIKALGTEAAFTQCDVSDEAQVQAMVAKAVATFGRVDFAFNNAGVGADGVTLPFLPLTELPEADWDCVIDTNLKGVFLCMKHELRQMRTQGGGVIVNTSSTSANHVMGGFGAYPAAKSGINVLTKLAAVENKDAGIRANVVAPGPTKGTGMSDRLLSAMKPGEGPPVHLMGDTEDVAAVVVFLCSEEGSFVNGNIIAVDGGLDIT
jgi:NAD(P)-dependent dehydrogenase (short-subunit alcohol dehydrogenase family)